MNSSITLSRSSLTRYHASQSFPTGKCSAFPRFTAPDCAEPGCAVLLFLGMLFASPRPVYLVGMHTPTDSSSDAKRQDPKRELLRHTVATVAYRGAKAVRNAPAGFADFRAGDGLR